MAIPEKISSIPEEEPGMDIASLIDVSFLLLIYFLATSTLQAREADIDMELPSMNSSTASAKGATPLEIEIDADGQIVLNPSEAPETLDSDPEQRALPLLRERVGIYKEGLDATGNNPIVIIAAHDDAQQQRFIDVMNCLSEVGIKTVSLSGFE